MEIIYVYDGDFSKGEGGYDLIRRAASEFCREMGFDYAPYEICKTGKGKPYFKDFPEIHFSLSHSGSLWVCMFSLNCCGIDIQQVVKKNYEKISKRVFTEDEDHYVRLWGLDGFFNIWTRREAMGKALGCGLFGDMPSTVSKNTDLEAEVSLADGEKISFKEIEISDDIKCACCLVNEKIDSVEFRLI